MKNVFFLAVVVLISACNDKAEQTPKANAELFTKPYTDSIPTIGAEKMKVQDWSFKSEANKK